MIEQLEMVSIKEFCNDNHLNYYKTLNFMTDQIKKTQDLLNRQLTHRELMELIEMAKIYFDKQNLEELQLK